ncbi:NEDD8-activating enzyme E1 catalytic subunit-like isoform X2 [Halichondria panicea]|uniref:NEDD8-activating enzyme E1 catalytic subunit-like isoform X2 n=1 Tax=Halichondria panicea TaxID=6063 RepID=UPI00312B90AC
MVKIVHDIALLGFRNLHCIDMDTIDLSNLNRQFLFRTGDVGKPKANVAAAFVSNRIPDCHVTPHYNKIQDFGPEFYQQFHVIICGLDSIVARRWINGMVLSLLRYDEEGQLDQSSIVPVIDGGTEGFKGNARVILPGITACIDCTLDFYPPQITYPLCTIASKPRLPEHCIEYVKVLQWPKEKPFGDTTIDGDSPDHIMWIYDKAVKRADEYKIQGVTYRLTQGVVKHIIPAVASTNAVIAAVCSTEAFKLASSCSKPLQNYMVFNDTDGVYTYSFEAEKKEECPSCSMKPVNLSFPEDSTLQDVYNYLCENESFAMKSPALTAVVDGRNKTLYLPTIESLEKATRSNLGKKLFDLGIGDNHEIVVADVTSPKPITIIVKYTYGMEE